MTLREYEEKMEAELLKLDWRDQKSKESGAYRLLCEAAKDREVTTEEWITLSEQYYKGVKG